MTKKGGFRYEQRTLTVMRIIGLVTPILLLAYGIFIALGDIPSRNYQGLGFFVVLMSLWIMMGIQQYMFPAQTKNHMMINLTIYHIFSGAFLLLITGFSVPFISALALLYLASYVYFSYLGAFISIVFFGFLLGTDVSWHHVDAGTTIYLVSSNIGAILVGVAAIALNRIKEYDREEIAKSKRQELLQRDRILTLINNVADAVISTDESGVIQIYNAASLNLLDTNTPIGDTPINEAVKLLDEEGNPVELLSLLQAAKSVVVNDSLQMRQGEEVIRLEVTYAPIRSAGRTAGDGYVIIMRDITKTKSLEEERDEFISVVSHELRTPIAIAEGAVGNAQLMFEKGGIDKKLIEKSLGSAHEQVIFLAKMVNDLSTLSRAERGVADAAELIDVKALAEELYNEYSPEASKKKLKLNLVAHGRLGQVMASRLYLHELLQNFITNSIKYTKEGSIDLVVEKKGGNVLFAVKDTGIGISKTDQAKIFEKFYRAEDYRTRETSGTGLGLYVSAKLAKKLGCKIDVKSRLNHGSIFSFSLPEAAGEPTRQ